MPLVVSLPNIILNPTLLSATRTLQSRGIADLATQLAIQGLPLAGRVKHFLSNWQAITQDEWVWQTIAGYRIEFLQKPYQNGKPPQIAFTEKEEECM